MYIKKGEESNLIEFISNYICLNCLKEAITEDNFEYRTIDLARRIKREILPLYEANNVIEFDLNIEKFEIVI
jgi:hypothetical protein